MVTSVIPIRWVTMACWLGRGRFRTNDCAWANNPQSSKPSRTSKARISSLDTAEASTSEVGFENSLSRNDQNGRLDAIGSGWLAASGAPRTLARRIVAGTARRDADATKGTI